MNHTGTPKELNLILIETLNRMKISDASTVVYDIDDTLLSPDKNQPIPEIIHTLIHAVKHGFNVSLITARPGTPNNIAWTVGQLREMGIHGYKNLYFIHPRKTSYSGISRYKTLARKHLWNTGHEVLISVGDKEWDMGEFGGIGFKVERD